MRQIILASQSKARKEIFSSLGIPFDVVPANINEKGIRDTDLSIRAVKIATEKASTIKESHPQAIIIAADTYSECEGKVFEKPATSEEANQMLLELSGKAALNYTGFCYIDPVTSTNYSTTVVTKYSFRKLYEKEIEVYVKEFPVTEWAAGFALVRPYVLSMISDISGSYTGLSHGLPLEILIPLLKESGFEPMPQK